MNRIAYFTSSLFSRMPPKFTHKLNAPELGQVSSEVTFSLAVYLNFIDTFIYII